MTVGEVALGLPVPPFTPHAISVSLPTWKDNVDYEEGSKRVADAMVSGYPRFFIHLNIQKVSTVACYSTNPITLSS
jgi:cystathionine gamma-synthase